MLYQSCGLIVCHCWKLEGAIAKCSRKGLGAFNGVNALFQLEIIFWSAGQALVIFCLILPIKNRKDFTNPSGRPWPCESHILSVK